jgi:hypothetical protein
MRPDPAFQANREAARPSEMLTPLGILPGHRLRESLPYRAN